MVTGDLQPAAAAAGTICTTCFRLRGLGGGGQQSLASLHCRQQPHGVTDGRLPPIHPRMHTASKHAPPFRPPLHPPSLAPTTLLPPLSPAWPPSPSGLTPQPAPCPWVSPRTRQVHSRACAASCQAVSGCLAAATRAAGCCQGPGAKWVWRAGWCSGTTLTGWTHQAGRHWTPGGGGGRGGGGRGPNRNTPHVAIGLFWGGGPMPGTHPTHIHSLERRTSLQAPI